MDPPTPPPIKTQYSFSCSTQPNNTPNTSPSNTLQTIPQLLTPLLTFFHNQSLHLLPVFQNSQPLITQKPPFSSTTFQQPPPSSTSQDPLSQTVCS